MNKPVNERERMKRMSERGVEEQSGRGEERRDDQEEKAQC